MTLLPPQEVDSLPQHAPRNTRLSPLSEATVGIPVQRTDSLTPFSTNHNVSLYVRAVIMVRANCECVDPVFCTIGHGHKTCFCRPIVARKLKAVFHRVDEKDWRVCKLSRRDVPLVVIVSAEMSAQTYIMRKPQMEESDILLFSTSKEGYNRK